MSQPPTEAASPPLHTSDDDVPADRRVHRRGSLVNYLAGALQGSLLVFHTLAARFFGVEAYGAYRWAWAAIEVAQQVGLLGLHQAALRGVAGARSMHDPGALRRTVGTTTGAAIWWSGAIALLVLILPALPLAARLPSEAATALRVLALMVPAWCVMYIWVYATMGTRGMRANLLVRGVTYPLALNAALLLVAWVWIRGGATALAATHVAAVAVALGVAARAYQRTFGERPSIAWRPGHWDRSMVRFSILAGGAEVANQALTRIDILLLGLLWRQPEALAAYGAAMILAEGVSGPRYAMDPLVSAAVTTAHVGGDRIRLAGALRDMVTWASALACPIAVGLLLWGDGLLRLWGAEYAVAWPALALLAATHLINTSLGLHQWVVVMSGRPGLDLGNNLVSLVAAALVCALAIPRLGAPGAALGALAGMGLLRLLQLAEAWRIARVHGLSWRWLRLLAAGLVSGAVQLAMRRAWGLRIEVAVAASVVGVIVYVIASGRLDDRLRRWWRASMSRS